MAKHGRTPRRAAGSTRDSAQVVLLRATQGSADLLIKEVSRILESSTRISPQATVRQLQSIISQAASLPDAHRVNVTIAARQGMRDAARLRAVPSVSTGLTGDENLLKQLTSARQSAGRRIPLRVGEQLRGSNIPNILSGSIPALRAVQPGIESAVARAQEATTPQRVVQSTRTSVPELVSEGKALVKAGRTKRLVGRGAIGAGLLAVIGPKIAELFGGGKDNIDPQVQLQLAQQLAGGGGAGGGPDTTRTLRDIARLLTIMKGLQELSGLGGQAVPQRLI